MAPALLALFALLACARAGASKSTEQSSKEGFNSNEARAFVQASLLSGCLYEGRWHASGATVETRETCLRCVCVRSALSCRRRACAPIMEPPPKRCHIRHRRESCCPELICPDGIVKREHAAARYDMDDFEDADTPNTVGLGLPACVEGGTVYAAGSAMSSNVACEQCFCLKGARKCVRPTCLPPPPHCVPRPTAGACCPQRYYCEYDSEAVKGHTFDCQVAGKRIPEGERVITGNDCTACFCLKGAVRCQELGCAPALHGCQPILRPGHCCAHQYKCDHQTSPTLFRGGSMSHQHHPITYNSLTPTRNDDRALHMQKWPKVIETTTKKILPDIYTSKNTPTSSATTNDLTYTIKVKRKTDEQSYDKAHIDGYTSQKPIASNTTVSTDENTTEQPEGTVKIVINGTINCTAELSSTSLPLSITVNDTDPTRDILPRMPIINGIEAQTYSPNDIITDSSILGDFDENEMFTINVTSSLNANTNSTLRPTRTKAPMKHLPVDVIKTLNNSKNAEDYDYDYTGPTLPPSLPNLKIIPFVAADAVLDEEFRKESHPYAILERDDKYPIYYPKDLPKDTSFTRREETYHPTPHPVFTEKNNDYDIMDLTSDKFSVSNLGYTIIPDLNKHKHEGKAVTKGTTTTISPYNVQTPAVNLFSPPIETEGGFIPKGSGVIDDYFAIFSSTPSVAVPHLTTSMQLDVPKAGDCTTEDGKRIPDGDNMTIECSECICTWGQLKCAPTLCRAPAGCIFKEPDPDSINQCCGDIICNTENKTATVAPVTEKAKVEKPKIEIPTKNESHDNPLQSSQLNDTVEQGHYLSSTLNTTNKQTHNISIEKPVKHTPTKTPFIDTTTKALHNNGSTPNTTTVTFTSTPKSTTRLTTSVPITNSFEVNDTSSEYEDEEDMGFSFGSVLKLLLSDNYDSTTKSPNNKHAPTKPPVKSSPPAITSTRRPTSTVNPFIPLPSLPFNPPKIVPSTVNKIDHLVLGEATAIKRTTTKRPTERSTERPNIEISVSPGSRPPSFSGSPGSSSPGVGSGLLKLAGCNIYGRIYRVGRIIAELSTPCLECWCIEIGVECKKLEC